MPIRKAHLERLKKEGYNPREIKAIQNGTSQNAVAQVKSIRDQIRKDPKLLKQFKDRLFCYRRAEEHLWTKDRAFIDYDYLFKRILNEPLSVFLVRMGQEKKKLKVFGWGCGSWGIFIGS